MLQFAKLQSMTSADSDAVTSHSPSAMVSGGRILPDAATSWPPDRPKYFDHARCITHALGGRAIVDRQAPNPKSAGVECGALAAIVR